MQTSIARSFVFTLLTLTTALAGCAGTKPSPVIPAATPHAPTNVNPFEGARMYVTRLRQDGAGSGGGSRR
jgi:hypothetical protein